MKKAAKAEEFKSLVTMGNQSDIKGDKNKAIEFYEKAHKLEKESPIPLGNLAIAFFELANFPQAEKYAKKTLMFDKENTSALIILGNIAYKQKKYTDALTYYKKAYELNIENPVSVVNIANTYFELKDFDEAIFYTEKAVELTPNDAWSYNNLSQLYQKKNRYEEALGAGYKAVERSDEEGRNAHHINLGYMLYEISLEYRELALAYAKKWLQKYGGNEVVNYMAKSVLNDEVLERANDEYLKNIFDVFAPDFEKVLQDLEYQCPEHINNFLQEIFGVKPQKKMRILDAGCGTGLCGKYLKKYAKIFGLHGVDISKEMIKEASKKRLYNKLFVEELLSFLSGKKDEYNLVVSTDVFIYFGDLTELFLKLNKAVKKDGRVIFSVSENIENDEVVLHSSGRFAHSEKYIKKLISKTGFVLEKISREHIRNEGEKKVFGFIISMYKKSV